MFIKRSISVIALAMAAVVTAGCGASQQAGPSASGRHEHSTVHADNPQEIVDFIRNTVHYDYEPVQSPAVLRRQSDIAVLGTISSVDSALQKTDAEDTGAVLVTLQVQETWKRDRAVPGATVTYVIPRPTNVAASVYEQALPVGTRVALFGTHAVETLLTEEPVGQVYDAAPQGLIFETGPGRAVNVWGDEASASGWKDVHSISDLRAATLSD
jgi:hypothetical protein